MGAELDGLGSLNDSLDRIADQWGSTKRVVYITGTNVSYAPAIEFGRGSVEAQNAEVLHFTIDGEEIFVKEVDAAPAQPFLRPALDAAKRQLDGLAKGSDSLEEFMAKVALTVEKEAKSRAPVDTGTLKASIRAERVE